MKVILHRLNLAAFILLTSLIVGCATQLAPLYDKAIVDGITAANKDAMTLFASASSGLKPESYSTRTDIYNKIIGSLDALEVQAKARPVPKTKANEAVNKWLEKRGIPTLTNDEVPSATAIGKISLTLKRMRDTDRAQGVTATEVQAFKNQTVIYMDQAITYESFLER
ncbi:hypothetical protein G9409_08275 [Chlorobium sp. BLA1]|uniref:hypothetical protein n=1 Tax=Candidatus Chlorobium masyuteum TaxID=2716876 RepID=UPI001423DDD4|nr:hypothetical protein [Candidatus Chlorobium masyuteum]NHQ60582.1 hypothetical protein [Candidatus Chlorobium masyuteum]